MGAVPHPDAPERPKLRTSLDAESRVTGKLSFSTPTRLDGKLRGEVSASELLMVGESGSIEGRVRVQELIVLGRVLGDIDAQSIEIGPQGSVEGSVRTSALKVSEGGRLDADCRITPPRARVHVLAEHRGEKPRQAHADTSDKN